MIKDKKILAVTLARGGSRRVPKKNIADINGKPLLVYTIEQVSNHILVLGNKDNLDDKEISDVASFHGVSVHKSPPEFARESTSSAESLLSAIRERDNYDYIVEIMATNPLKTAEDIDGVIEKLHETQADSVVSVVRIWDHHPSRIKYIEGDRLKDFYPERPESRRQDLTPAAYVRNGSIYATTKESFLSNKVRLGPDTRPYIMDESKTINIDEPIDLELARLLLR